MLSPIVGRRKKHKRYNYQPRYYKPEKDNIRKGMRRMKFQSHSDRGQAKSVILLAAFLFLVFYIMLNIDTVVERMAIIIEYMRYAE